MSRYNTDNTTIAAYRVFETLKYLMHQPASVTDIMKHLETLDLNSGKPLSKGVIYKYIATLKFAGIKISRKNCKYLVKDLPFKIPFNSNNIKAVLLMEEIINQLPKQDIFENIRKLIYSIKMTSIITPEDELNIKQEIQKIKFNIPTENQAKTIEEYEKYCKDNLKINIEYKDMYGESCKVICEPIEVKFEDNQVYLYSYSASLNNFVEFNSKQIIKITQMPSKCSDSRIHSLSSSTVFKLTDKLAKRYKPRADETVQYNEDELTVMNKIEDKNKLLHRLMRYGALCEIKSPKTERNKMKEMIAKTLSNYNVST